MDFRSRLREEIEYSGKMYKEVAEAAGIAKSTMDSYVGAQGSIPSADVAVRLAQVLGVSVEYLVTGKGGETVVSRKEKHIISCLNMLPEYERNALEQYIETLAKKSLSSSAFEKKNSGGGECLSTFLEFSVFIFRFESNQNLNAGKKNLPELCGFRK